MKKQKWYYQEKTLKFSPACMAALAIVFFVGSSIVDKELNPSVLYLFGSVMILTTALSYLFRNNP